MLKEESPRRTRVPDIRNRKKIIAAYRSPARRRKIGNVLSHKMVNAIPKLCIGTNFMQSCQSFAGSGGRPRHFVGELENRDCEAPHDPGKFQNTQNVCVRLRGTWYPLR